VSVMLHPEGTSSTGRASVSKTEGIGLESISIGTGLKALHCSPPGGFVATWLAVGRWRRTCEKVYLRGSVRP